MALLRRRLTSRTLISVITAVLVLAVGMPLVSAYEAHTINVTVRVEERPTDTLVKTMRLATGDETSGEIYEFLTLVGSMDPPIPNFPSGVPNIGCDNATNVPINTFILWLVTISVSNTDDYCWTDVVVKDNFSAELGGVTIGEVPVDVFVKEHSRGNSKKEKIIKEFETQYRITWYVTCEGWDEVNEVCLVQDPIGLCPGESAHIEMYVWTKLNPAGHQEYTSPGTYTMNSGPNLKWYDLEDHQHSFDGEPLYITAE